MTRTSAIADSLSRVVFLLRDSPEDKEGQKTAFRALLIRLEEKTTVFTASSTGMAVNGHAVGPDVPGGAALREQLLAHGIGELLIPGSLMPPQLLIIVRALATTPGTFPHLQQLNDHFAANGVHGVEITPPIPSTGRRPSQPDPATATPDPDSEPTESSSRGDRVSQEIEALGPDAVNEESVGLLHFVTLQVKSIGRLDELLFSLEQDPNSARTLDWLNEVLGYGDIAVQKEQWGDLVRAAAALIRLEGRVEDESHRRLYNIALRRLVSPSSMVQITRLLPTQDLRADATSVLRRIGADAMEVLINALIAAEDVGHRRVYFNAVTQMTEGADLLVHMLGHDEWFVVRNVAELCGEMKLEAAVPALAKLVTHQDERVRRAATSALARIGSAGTIEPLQRAMQDTSAVVRAQAAAGLDGPRFKHLVPSLARVLDEESHPEVLREMLHALGRIGTPEAVETLIRASQRARGLFKKKPLAIRVEAVEGLRLAGGPAAKSALGELERDREEDVRQAAQAALKNSKR